MTIDDLKHHRYRPDEKCQTAPMTAMYVRRQIGQNRCDQFIDAQLASETTTTKNKGAAQ